MNALEMFKSNVRAEMQKNGIIYLASIFEGDKAGCEKNGKRYFF